MIYSSDRILTAHAGSLPRPDDLRQMVLAKSEGEPVDDAALKARLSDSVADVVKRQVAAGIDIVNDGEFSKPGFSAYCRERIGGTVMRKPSGGLAYRMDMTARDQTRFKGYFESKPPRFNLAELAVPTCVEPLTFIGQDAVQQDIANFKAALAGVDVAEAYLPANTPGTIEHWMDNDYYKTQEEFVFAVAEAMREEYNAIVEAGFTLQIDDPDLPDGWNCLPEMSVADYRKYAQLRVEALNHALRDIPPESVRLHVCWGSFHGPHAFDIPLTDIADIIFSVRAKSFSIEAANPVHEHEWRVFEDYRIPEGATLVPGVVGHCTDFIEHPDLVAERIVRYANLVGRENVIAGTDCGLGHRVGHPEICWAKLESLSEGARRATKLLWH